MRPLAAFLFSTVLAGAAGVSSAAFSNDLPPAADLVIYTYDSFMAKGGPGPELVPLFEKLCGCKVRALVSGDGAQILTRLELDRKRGKSIAHVALGVDQHLWSEARPFAENWGRWRPSTWPRVRKEVQVEEGFLPFDYGEFALMADTVGLKKLKLTAPRTLRDLLRPEFRRNIILQDPRTATPGLALMLFSETTLGKEGAHDFWKRMKAQWLTLAPGWSGAYGLFLKGEAPLVWSYTTSQAYHEEHGDSARRYRAIVFDEGQPLQIEGAFLVKGAPHRSAQGFLEFLVSGPAQKILVAKNWMLPVLEGVPLPPSFKGLPTSKKRLMSTPKKGEIKEALARWAHAIGPGADQ